MIKINLLNEKRPPRQGQYRSQIVLTYDDWNDYGYRTSFCMYYCDPQGNIHEIGAVKIYYRENEVNGKYSYCTHTRDSLGHEIRTLPKDYCSLGQDLNYYENIKKLLPKEFYEVLTRLNDIAIHENIKNTFIERHGVTESLLRFSSAQKALNEAKAQILGQKITEKDISFSYQLKMPYDSSTTRMTFNFTRHDFLPYRINIIIGKNGTGKTQLLSHLANSLSGYTENKEADCFIGNRPPIDKVMSISYSAFDCFKKPPQDFVGKRSIFSYVYCGIQSEHGTLSLQDLKNNLSNAFKTVKAKQRTEVWHEVLSELMEEEHKKTVEAISAENFDAINLSSGQQILICTMTELIANIENESIILFDEPEIHLHPNAISNVVRMFYKLLDIFNSYAIFTTHSPIILQEIPSKYIQIIERIDGMPFVRKPDVECFGNNISNIIFDVFDVKGSESNYKSIIRKMLQYKTKDEIRHLFGNKLSLNALIYLENQDDVGGES